MQAAHIRLTAPHQGPAVIPGLRERKGHAMTELVYPKCANDICARPMRPRGTSAESAPGTVAMGHKGQCKSCGQPRVKARRARQPLQHTPQDPRVAYTASGLNSYLARRYARGVPPEAAPSIPSRTVMAEVISFPIRADQELAAA